MSDLAYLIFIIFGQVVLVVAFVVAFICECLEVSRRQAEEARQNARPPILPQGAIMLAALEDRRAALAEVRRRDVLPYFPYPAQQKQGEGESEAAECAICVEPLLQGQLCSEVPECRHAFHRECLGKWARSKGTCPLCRAMIVIGSSNGAAAAAGTN